MIVFKISLRECHLSMTQIALRDNDSSRKRLKQAIESYASTGAHENVQDASMKDLKGVRNVPGFVAPLWQRSYWRKLQRSLAMF